MLMMVKTGKRSLSKKALYRLDQAEVDVGLRVRKDPVIYRTKKTAPNAGDNQGVAVHPDQLKTFMNYMKGEFGKLQEAIKKLDDDIKELKKGRKT